MARIALLGTGLLGASIGHRLLEQGHSLKVWNRTPEKCQALLEAGGQAISSLSDGASDCDTVISVLRDGPASAAVLQQLGELEGSCVMGMGTMAIAESQALEQQIKAQHGTYLEAPVLGSRPEALKGSLLVMAGGSAELFERQRPILETLSAVPRLMGPVGSGMASKLALNQLIASLTHGFSLALRLVQAQGVGVEEFMEVLRPSAVYAPTYDKKLERMLDQHYDNPNFSTALLRKDLGLFLQASQQAGLDASGLQGILELLQQAQGDAIDGLDYCALHELTQA
jgi:3-hydroxyisobutyrate dehydrogenase